ncbi:hypothetical protein [Siccibacter turicensis]
MRSHPAALHTAALSADGRRWSGFRLILGVNDAPVLRWEKVVAIATRIHQQMDLTLFHPLPLKA